jgi:hypothetical protein
MEVVRVRERQGIHPRCAAQRRPRAAQRLLSSRGFWVLVRIALFLAVFLTVFLCFPREAS